MPVQRHLPMLPSCAPSPQTVSDDVYRPLMPDQEDGIIRDLIDAYLRGLPVVIGYSSGKDSSMLLALYWTALRRVQERYPGALMTPVIVVAGDTKTENPLLHARLTQSVANMRQAARRERLPISVHVAVPALDDQLLVRIIGHGYPAPTPVMRWCVERVKINPARHLVDRLVGPTTPAIFTLGTRKGESARRNARLNRAEASGSSLQPNTARPGSFIHEPLGGVSLGQVWHYLETHACPWSDNWFELAALYREASDVCPIQMPGTSRNVCGTSRFGCWMCTVVSGERSMRNMAAGAAPWMRKMVEFRDLLYATTAGPARQETRSLRGGEEQTINLTGKGKETGEDLSPRGYTLAFRKRLLALLLDAEDEARRLGPDPHYRLLEDDALRAIQVTWERDWGDWGHSAVDIARPYRGDAWAPPAHPRLAPLRQVPGWPAVPCRQRLVQDTAHAADLPPVLLWRFVHIMERFRDQPTYAGLVAANRRLAALLVCDWRSDGVLVADLLRERATERESEEDRQLQGAERARLAERARQPALVEVDVAAPPSTQADVIVTEIMETLVGNPTADVWDVVVRAPRHGTAPPWRARRVEDEGRGAIDWGVTWWFDRLTRGRDAFYCRDGSYGYVSGIYGTAQGRAQRWVSYPPARRYTGAHRPPAHVVLGTRAARYQALAYVGGRWRRAEYDREEMRWRYIDAHGAVEGYAPWHAEPLCTASHAALRLERPLDDTWRDMPDATVPAPACPTVPAPACPEDRG